MNLPLVGGLDPIAIGAQLRHAVPMAANRDDLTAGALEKGTGSREMIHVRACELALTNGRDEGQVTQADYEQAKRDVRGKRAFDRPE
jgi:hypothetical protein